MMDFVIEPIAVDKTMVMMSTGIKILPFWEFMFVYRLGRWICSVFVPIFVSKFNCNRVGLGNDGMNELISTILLI